MELKEEQMGTLANAEPRSPPHTERGIVSSQMDGDSDCIEGVTCECPPRASRRPGHLHLSIDQGRAQPQLNDPKVFTTTPPAS